MYSINGAHAAGGNPIYAQQGRARQAWINKFNSQARTAERKADERLAVDVTLGAAVGALGGPVGALEGAVGGVGINLVTPYIYRVLGISEHSH